MTHDPHCNCPDCLGQFIDQQNAAVASAAAVMGRKGGASKSDAKQSASRANGRIGGRPAKAEAVFIVPSAGGFDQWEPALVMEGAKPIRLRLSDIARYRPDLDGSVTYQNMAPIADLKSGGTCLLRHATAMMLKNWDRACGD